MISMNWLLFQWVPPFINNLIQYLIGNPHLYQLVEAFWRARAGARRAGRTPRAKMLRPIDKGVDFRLDNGLNC